MTPDMHYRLALQIADRGIRRYNDDVLRYVAELRRSGHRSTALDIAADPAQPDVARERAFGRLPVAVETVDERVASKAA
jgi:hypothetical protein